MQLKYHMVTIEDLVPEDHFLRKLERALDLSFVYEESAHLYSRRYGRPPIDPVEIVKYSFAGFPIWHPIGTADRAAVREQQRISMVSGHRPG